MLGTSASCTYCHVLAPFLFPHPPHLSLQGIKKILETAAADIPVVLFPTEPVFIGIEEKLTVQLAKTGGLESLEVQGTMSLVIGNEADAFVSIAVSVAFPFLYIHKRFFREWQRESALAFAVSAMS